MNNMWILGDATVAVVIGMEVSSAQGELSTIQLDGSNGAPLTDEPSAKTQGPNMMLWFMLPVLLVYMFFMFRGPKKKQQEHNKMVSSLAKNDRVRTIGGIFGTVLDVRDDEIVLKVDESTNTKMRVSPQAIATVLTDKTE
ncbi:MAG: preprotein translocase subunit YajC [Anaerohalosphaeraceae bacterium]